MNRLLAGVGLGLLALAGVMMSLALLAFRADVLGQQVFWMNAAVSLVGLLSLGLSKLRVDDKAGKAVGAVFILFGSLTAVSTVPMFPSCVCASISYANIHTGAVSCTPQAPVSCTVDLLNSGTEGTRVVSCNLTFADTTTEGAVSPWEAYIPARTSTDGSAQVTCATSAGMPGAAGTPVAGAFTFSNGAVGLFNETQV